MSHKGYYERLNQRTDQKGERLISGMTINNSDPCLLSSPPSSPTEADRSSRWQETYPQGSQDRNPQNSHVQFAQGTSASEMPAQVPYTSSPFPVQQTSQPHGIDQAYGQTTYRIDEGSEQNRFNHPPRRDTDVWFCCGCHDSGPNSSLNVKCTGIHCQHERCPNCRVEKVPRSSGPGASK